MNISFGKKIPITKSQIFDNEHQKFVPVTCCSFDCSDKSDILEIEQMGDDWRYIGETLGNMRRKLERNNSGMLSPVIVYTLEKDNGEKLGLCCCDDTERRMEVNYIETKQDGKHKFAGQVLLASIGTQMLDNSRQWSFIIRNAISSAYDFYQQKCGFKENDYNSDLHMNRSETRKFIKQTEQRTKAPIIELRA